MSIWESSFPPHTPYPTSDPYYFRPSLVCSLQAAELEALSQLADKTQAAHSGKRVAADAHAAHESLAQQEVAAFLAEQGARDADVERAAVEASNNELRRELEELEQALMAGAARVDVAEAGVDAGKRLVERRTQELDLANREHARLCENREDVDAGKNKASSLHCDRHPIVLLWLSDGYPSCLETKERCAFKFSL